MSEAMRCAGCVFLACFLAAGLFAASDDAPLRDEDVVRLLVAGTPVEELIERIRTSAVDFDLSEEMLDELRLAGVPPEVVQAMLERQQELHPPETPEPPPSATPAEPVLRVRLNSDWKPKKDQPRPLLRLLDAVPPQAVEAFRLRADERTFDDLALVLFCRTPTHVPDHWRNHSPLGRDFNSVPRHKMLAFLAGARKTKAGKMRRSLSKLALSPGEKDLAPELGVLELEVPEQIEVELQTGEAHDLMLGIAVRAGTRYLLVAQDVWDGLLLTDEDRVIDAWVASKKLDATSLEARFVKPEAKD